MSARGGVVWFTGLSGAGKSTLATAVAQALAGKRASELLDGDEVRTFVSAGLGFSRADRDTNVHRIAYIARLLAKHGVLALVSAISPYAETRAAVKQRSLDAGHAFVEVFVDAPLAVVEARDVKGLYAKARRGELPAFTGISDPYEAPVTPDLHVHSGRDALDACIAQVIAGLAQRELI